MATDGRRNWLRPSNKTRPGGETGTEIGIELESLRYACCGPFRFMFLSFWRTGRFIGRDGGHEPQHGPRRVGF